MYRARWVRSSGGAGDAAAIAAIYRPYVERSHSTFEESLPDEAEIARATGKPASSVAGGGSTIGGSSAMLRPRRCETAPPIAGASRPALTWRRKRRAGGLAAQPLAAHLDLLNRQGFVTAIAGIALPNEGSVALHEKLGFTLFGIERGVGFKLGHWVDVGRWQRDLAPRTSEPPNLSISHCERSEGIQREQWIPRRRAPRNAAFRCGSACRSPPSPLP